MSLANDFERFCFDIKLDNWSDMEKTIGEIAKKLNKSYYNLDSNPEDHTYIVGSVGRKTAVKGNSDVDILFDLPEDVYKKFDSYENNGQSALIQEVKNVLLERYPRTDIRGDGQVVVINFDKYMIELVPGFKQKDETFKYPDTHDGGSWKITDPVSEIAECLDFDEFSNGIYFDFCHIIRMWKNQVDLEIGGLLIDTLIYNFFQDQDNNNLSRLTTENYLCLLIELYKYLGDQNPHQEYWFAVGSNQCVYNTSNGDFVESAEEAYNSLEGKTNSSDDINELLRDLLGSEFPCVDTCSQVNSALKKNNTCRGPSEEFIEEVVQVELRFDLHIDCRVTQDGWRPFKLREFLIKKCGVLMRKKQLKFFVAWTNCPEPYEIWWKVRNVGPIAEQENMIRGNIIKQKDTSDLYEHTDFYGPHYVECFLIKDQKCVARDRIDVPIGNVVGD